MLRRKVLPKAEAPAVEQFGPVVQHASSDARDLVEPPVAFRHVGLLRHVGQVRGVVQAQSCESLVITADPLRLYRTVPKLERFLFPRPFVIQIGQTLNGRPDETTAGGEPRASAILPSMPGRFRRKDALLPVDTSGAVTHEAKIFPVTDQPPTPAKLF